jgi:hypothetical protein
LKNIFFVFLLVMLFVSVHGQQPAYWQQQVNTSIEVTLNDKDHSMDGVIKMAYLNRSPDTLRFIWIHLWPNAYKNDRTALSEQLLENGRTDFYFSEDNKRGYINKLNFKVDGASANTESDLSRQDMVKLLLPHPLAPMQEANIETPFHVKLPAPFSRSGHLDQSYQITQWYPKPAVYDSKGWHPIPYLDQGEFYGEFGNYQVRIHLPEKYVVAATGMLKSTVLKEGGKTLYYEQNNIHDFAWFADADFEVLHDTLLLKNAVIDVNAYYYPGSRKHWTNSIQYIKRAIRSKSEWVGGYPYPVVSVVEKSGEADGGGMEYPTITLISATTDERMLDYLINHEVGHNWFYGILASNERQHPWMDEGINSFYDQRYFMQQYGISGPDFLDMDIPFIQKRKPADFQMTMLETICSLRKDQPIETASERFTESNYNAIAYSKAAEWMKLLEKRLGRQSFDSVMRTYYDKFQFKHPYPEDFKAVAETVSGKNLDSLFALLLQKGSLQTPRKKDIRLETFFSLKETDKHHYLFVGPALGYNYYDKLMLGVSLHNYTLPPSKLQFFVAPMYAVGSKSLTGLGRVGYTCFTGENGQQAQISLAAASFTGDQFTEPSGIKNNQPFLKIVPALKYRFGNKNPRSTMSRFLQLKSFLLSETGLLFSRDSAQNTDIISYPKERSNLLQLQFVINDNRVLYPYKAAFEVEHGNGFVRTQFTGHYYFNYAQEGGMQLRFFAGKFFYTTDKTYLSQYKTDRYHLNMSGAKGNEDYTYGNYFVGRNEFEGFSNQQIMIRDGGFKVRTDLLSDKIGRTDDWLAAVNLCSSIPKNIDPMQLFPVKIPLKVFADFGTYSDAWKNNSGTPRILYDAGLQLSLLKNTVHFYFPLLYSKVYRDYFKSTITEKRFIRNISFSIDLQQVSLKKLFPQIPF